MEKNLKLSHVKVIVLAVAAWVKEAVADALGKIEKYVLPAASEETLGGIKAGEGLVVEADGTAKVDFTSANEYADTAAQNAAKYAAQKVDAILADAPEAFDTFKELADYIESHKDVKEALEQAIGEKLGKDELVYATDAEVTGAIEEALAEPEAA
ncbi:MAG: hypothetical protein K2K81_07390 [Muribaculaceae bacterium]|nr:hypothetical protein [Muribaculaceae bacterium]